jgi:hypothetical protein
LQVLQHLFIVIRLFQSSIHFGGRRAYLELNLGFCDILFATGATSNFLGFSDLGSYGLSLHLY